MTPREWDKSITPMQWRIIRLQQWHLRWTRSLPRLLPRLTPRRRTVWGELRRLSDVAFTQFLYGWLIVFAAPVIGFIWSDLPLPVDLTDEGNQWMRLIWTVAGGVAWASFAMLVETILPRPLEPPPPALRPVAASESVPWESIWSRLVRSGSGLVETVADGLRAAILRRA